MSTKSKFGNIITSSFSNVPIVENAHGLGKKLNLIVNELHQINAS